MSWWQPFGQQLKTVLSKGLDLVLTRLVRIQGSLSGVELEIQRRVPDLPAPAASALAAHVARSSEAAIAMTSAPAKPFEDLDKIPVNPMLADRLDPADRFLYTTDVSSGAPSEGPMATWRVDVASSIPLSYEEVAEFAARETEERWKEYKDPFQPDKPNIPDGWENYVLQVDVNGVVRVF